MALFEPLMARQLTSCCCQHRVADALSPACSDQIEGKLFRPREKIRILSVHGHPCRPACPLDSLSSFLVDGANVCQAPLMRSVCPHMVHAMGWLAKWSHGLIGPVAGRGRALRRGQQSGVQLPGVWGEGAPQGPARAAVVARHLQCQPLYHTRSQGKACAPAEARTLCEKLPGICLENAEIKV